VRTRGAIAIAVALGLALVLTIVVQRHGDEDEPNERAGTQLRIDEIRGSYAGVTMGDDRDAVVDRLGEPGGTEGFVPLDEEFGDVGGPPAVRVWPPDDRGEQAVLRYDGVAFLVGSRGVYAFVVTDDGARTRRGVAVGDPLARARSRYRLGCSEGIAGEPIAGGPLEKYPTCRGTIDDRRRIWFGEDRIRSIAVARVGRG
jgi:hypothetical protein